MDPWQSGFNPLKPGIIKIAICGFLLGVINSNVAAVPARPSPSYPDAVAVLDDFTNFWKALFFGGKNVCWSEGCSRAARNIRRNIDDRVEPCTNFYKFACGGFIEKRTIPDGAQSLDVYRIVRNDLRENLVSLIENENVPNDPKSFQLIEKLYKSCTSTTEDREIEHVKEILRKLGGWPLLEGDSWDDTRFNWKRWMYEARKVGDPGKCFFGFTSSPNAAGTKIVIKLTRPEMENRIWSVIDPGWHNIENYYNSFVQVAQIFGADKDRAIAEIKESFLFAAEIVNIILPRNGQNLSSVLFNGTFLELKKAHPSVKWSDYFSNFLPSNTSLPDDEIVMVENPFYYTQLEAVVSNATKRVQANYAFWRLIWDKMPYINGKIKKLYLKMKYDEDIEPISLRDECLNDIKDSFAYSLNAGYVRKYFSKEMKNDVTDMFQAIKEQLIITLQQAEWLDEETRRVVLEKAVAIKGHIGYHDALLNDTVDEYLHRGMKFTEDNYLGNKFNQISATLAAESNALLQGPQKELLRDVVDVTATVNAFYNVPTNDLRVLASILRDDFYDIDRPVYMNYGAIGNIIGHELIHGFDDRNIVYDKNGERTDSWTALSKDALKDRAQCLIDQYANFTGDKSKVFRDKPLNENIADNGGIKLAYRGYKNWVAKNNEERRLPGLEDYSPIQMFWISAASIECAKETEENLKSQIFGSTHPVHEFRVIEMASNMQEFAEDFECSKKSELEKDSTTFAMIPEKRCSVW